MTRRPMSPQPDAAPTHLYTDMLTGEACWGHPVEPADQMRGSIEYSDGSVRSTIPRCKVYRPRYPIGTLLYCKEPWRVVDHDFGTPPSAWLIDYRDGGTSWGNPPEAARVKWAEQFGTADTHGGPDPRWRQSLFMPRWAARLWLRVESVKAEQVTAISEEDAKAEGVESVAAFRALWDSLHRKDGCGWEADWPGWVWAYTFRVLGPEETPH